MFRFLAALVFLVCQSSLCCADDTKVVAVLGDPFETPRIAAPIALVGMWRADLDGVAGKIHIAVQLSSGPDNLISASCVIGDASHDTHVQFDATIYFHVIDNVPVALLRQDQPLDENFLQSFLAVRPFYAVQIKIEEDDILSLLLPTFPLDKNGSGKETDIFIDEFGRILLTGASKDVRETIVEMLKRTSSENVALKLHRDRASKQTFQGVPR